MSDQTKNALIYCVKCRAKVNITDPQPMTMGNMKNAIYGFCPHCGTKCIVIVKKPA